MSRVAVAVCAKNDLPKAAAEGRATHLVSILDPGDSVTRPADIPPPAHLRVHFVDEEDQRRPGAPTRADIARILGFAKALPDGARLLVHCDGGTCRSTAAAFAILAQEAGRGQELQAMKALLEAQPDAVPNTLVAKHADAILGTGTRVFQLADEQADRRMARRLADDAR